MHPLPWNESRCCPSFRKGQRGEGSRGIRGLGRRRKLGHMGRRRRRKLRVEEKKRKGRPERRKKNSSTQHTFGSRRCASNGTRRLDPRAAQSQGAIATRPTASRKTGIIVYAGKADQEKNTKLSPSYTCIKIKYCILYFVRI